MVGPYTGHGLEGERPPLTWAGLRQDRASVSPEESLQGTLSGSHLLWVLLAPDHQNEIPQCLK